MRQRARQLSGTCWSFGQLPAADSDNGAPAGRGGGARTRGYGGGLFELIGQRVAGSLCAQVHRSDWEKLIVHGVATPVNICMHPDGADRQHTCGHKDMAGKRIDGKR